MSHHWIGKTTVLGFVSLAVLALMSACSAPDKPVPSETQPPEAMPSTPATEAIATEAPQPQSGETSVGDELSIVILIPEDPTAFNGVVADTGYNQMVMELALLGLTDVDAQGNVFPELAAELPTQENGGVRVDDATGKMDVTWKLRPGVTWADGEALDADDVLFTWSAITDPDGGIWTDGVDVLESLEKIDATTFIAHYSSIYTGYLTQFGGENMAIFASHYCNASEGFVNWDCNLKPLSSGPYVLEEWVTGDHLTFVRNPRYYQTGKPAIDRIVVKNRAGKIGREDNASAGRRRPDHVGD